MSSDVIRTLKMVFGKGGLIEEYKRQEQMLEETPIKMTIIERDLKRCEFLSAEIPRAIGLR